MANGGARCGEAGEKRPGRRSEECVAVISGSGFLMRMGKFREFSLLFRIQRYQGTAKQVFQRLLVVYK